MRRADSPSPRAAVNPPTVPDPLLYLYAIAETDDRLIAQLASDPVRGIDPEEPLFAIQSDQLAAVVSRVSGETFQEEPLNALLSDLPRLTPFVIAHDTAVTKLFGRGWNLIPMRFGVVYLGSEQVAALLCDSERYLLATVARIRGKEEWGVKLFVEHSRLQEAAERATEELQLLAAAIDSAAPGHAYLLSKRRDRLVGLAADRLLRELVDRVLDSLGALSSAIHRDEVANTDADGPVLVLKLAMLVEAGETTRLRACVRELEGPASTMGGSVKLSGPWAPYSFVDDGRGGA